MRFISSRRRKLEANMPKNPPSHKQAFRKSGSPRSAADLLADITGRRVTAGGSSHIEEKAGKNTGDDALARIRMLLPADLAPHLREVRVRDGMLIVYSESAAWGARLRLWLMEHMVATASAPLPGLAPGAQVRARVMPAGGYRR